MTPPNPADPSKLHPDQISEVLMGLLGSFDKEALAAVAQLPESPTLVQAKAALASRDPDHFDLFWRGAFDTQTRGLLMAHGIAPSSRAGELMAHGGFYRQHLRELFCTFEGAACCADKARWALRRLFRYYHEGTPIEVTGGDSAYWEPRTILNSQEWLLEFFEALYRLRAGNPSSYLTAMHRVATHVAPR